MKQNIEQLQKCAGLYIQTKKDGADKFILSIIRRRIIDLIKSLSTINTSYIRKTVAFSMMVIGLGNAQAQTFDPVQVNPFGLNPQGMYNSPVLADLDNDGDLDILNSQGYNQPIQYFENIGSTTSPSFGIPQVNPFGLSLPAGTYFFRMAVADMDGDGDMDLITSSTYYTAASFNYYENIGTANSPNFAAPVQGLGGSIPLNTYQILLMAPTMGDLDDDGDIDILLGTFSYSGLNDIWYYENTGTATNPVFGNAVSNPFNIGSGLVLYAIPELTDIDSDGDLDMFFSDYTTSGEISFYENIGTAQAANFGSRQDNPFGLTSIITLAHITSGDLDNDGNIDLLIGDAYDSLNMTAANFNYFGNQGIPFSVEELDLSGVTLYPSPVNDLVHLDFNFIPETIAITDVQGKVVKTVNMSNITAQTTIDVSNLNTGIYAIIIGKANRKGTKRFIKH